MSARLYPNAVELFVDDATNEWEEHDIRAIFLGASFVFNPALAYRDELAAGNVIAESGPLEQAGFVDGLATGLPFLFEQLLDNRQVANAVIYADTGDPATSPLLLWIGEDSLVGAPFTPSGQNYFLYPVTPPGGFFVFSSEPLIGPLNTFPLGAAYALGVSEGGISYVIPELHVGSRLVVRDKICAPPEEEGSCCRPTIRGSLCE